MTNFLISTQNKSINPVTKFLMVSVDEILTSLAKAKGYTILRALKEPKTWIELEKIAKGDKSSVSRRIDEFIRLGLVKPILLEDSPKGSKAYVLTEFGMFILKKLEEIEEYSKKL